MTRLGPRIPWFAALAALNALVTGCWAAGTTTRIVDGRTIVGKPVSDEAYAAYARAALLEARGDLKRAAQAYEEAIEEDADSPETWTRLGVVLCRLGKAGAMEAFEEALEVDTEYGPAYREAAECLRRRRHAEQALVHARRAVALSPDDVAATVLTARLLESLGRHAEARRWYGGLVAAQSTDVEAVFAIASFARRSNDRALALWARTRLSRMETARAPESGPDDDPWLDALERGDLVQARSLASTSGISTAELALRALDVHALDAARRQARLVLRANPANTDARVALVAASRRRGDQKSFQRALQPRGDATRPGKLAAEVYAEELRVIVGQAAAELFLRAHAAVSAVPEPPRPKPPLPRPPRVPVPTGPDPTVPTEASRPPP